MFQTDGRTVERTDGRTVGRSNGRTDGRTVERTDGRTVGQNMLEFQTDVERKTDTEPTRETWTRGVAGAGPKAKKDTETHTHRQACQTCRQAGNQASARVVE